MKPIEIHVQKQMVSAWNAIKLAQGKMLPASDVRPAAGEEIFKCVPCPSAQVKFEIGPIVFRMPERANHRETNLYIAIKGWISFDGENLRKNLHTKGFATTIGYFRLKGGNIEHVYGAHYDLDESTEGHPVFHSQISPQMDLISQVREKFKKQDETAEDKVQYLLRNVRTPSAQMDVFSVIAQICADHLVYEKSDPEVISAFEKMRNACNFFTGAAHRMTFLNADPASHCYRSTHWYDGKLIDEPKRK